MYHEIMVPTLYSYSVRMVSVFVQKYRSTTVGQFSFSFGNGTNPDPDRNLKFFFEYILGTYKATVWLKSHVISQTALPTYYLTRASKIKKSCIEYWVSQN